MGRNAIIVTTVTLIVSGAPALYAQGGTLEKLNTANLEIAEIDMAKNYGAAGDTLDRFYTGHANKRSSSAPVVYLDSQPEGDDPAAASGALCNAEPHKIRKVASKVGPLRESAPAEPENSGKIPVTGGLLAIGAITLGAAGIRKSFWGDLETVADAVAHPIETHNDFQAANAYEQSQQTSQPNPQHPAVVNVVHNSSGSVTVSTGTDHSCPSSSTDCIGGAYLDQFLEPYKP